MSSTGLDLKDLKNGTLNTLEDSSAAGTTGDPRRTNAVASLRRTQADAYAPDTIGPRSEYVGIVVAQYAIDFPGFTDKAGLLRQYQMGVQAETIEEAREVEKTRNTAYKVFIPEIDPRPVPAFDDLEDPITISLPEVYANIPQLKAPIPPGSAVVVQYEDPKNLGAPTIVRVVTDQLTVGTTNLNDRGCRKWKGSLAKNWNSRRNTAGGVPNMTQNMPSALATDSTREQWVKDHKDDCPGYARDGARAVKGSELFSAKRLHQTDWSLDDQPLNPVGNGWCLPMRPGEAGVTKAKNKDALRASSGFNRGNTVGTGGHPHGGIDLSGGTGTPQYAVNDATVTLSRSVCWKGKGKNKASTAGNYIEYKTVDGYYVRHIHLAMPPDLKKGDSIKKGQIIGYTGDTGGSGGPHAHIDVALKTITSVAKKDKLHLGDFYPDGWILFRDTDTPVAQTRRGEGAPFAKVTA